MGVKRGGGAKLPSAENILVLVSVLEEPIHGVIHKTNYDIQKLFVKVVWAHAIVNLLCEAFFPSFIEIWLQKMITKQT